VSAYGAAIDRTVDTIERRARAFRTQIAAVVLMGLGAIVWSILARSPAPLVWAAGLVPVCGWFFLVDDARVRDWRVEILNDWAECRLEMAGFRHAIRAHPSLPRDTLEGMLASLPSSGELATERLISIATREAVVAAVLANYRWRSDALALKTVGSLIVTGAIIAAVTLRRWEPLLALTGLAPVSIVAVWTRRRGLALAKREVTARRRRAEFSEADYTSIHPSAS
jgi:hypothetical protein